MHYSDILHLYILSNGPLKLFVCSKLAHMVASSKPYNTFNCYTEKLQDSNYISTKIVNPAVITQLNKIFYKFRISSKEIGESPVRIF